MARKRTLAERMSWQPKGGQRRGRLPLMLLIVILLLVAVAAYTAFASSLLWVNEVTVSGTKSVNPDDVKDATLGAAESNFGLFRSRSIVLIDEGKVSQGIKERFSDVAKVTVTKQWPRTLLVEVQERQTTLLWKSNNAGYLVDRQGVAFEQSGPRTGLLTVEDSTNLPVEVGKQVVGSSFITALEQIKAEMDQAGITVTGFRIPETTFEVQAVTNQGYYVIFDTTRPIATQVDALRRAVATGKPREYADVRVPGRVYLK